MAPAAAELRQQLQDDFWHTRREAAKALGSLGDGADLAIESLGQNLLDTNWRVRRAAAESLADLSEAEVWGHSPGKRAIKAVPELAKRLGDEDLFVRRAVKSPLNELKANRSIGDLTATVAPAYPELRLRLEDEDWRRREAAARALPEFGAIAMQSLTTLARMVVDDSVMIRDAAKESLERFVRMGYYCAHFGSVLPAVLWVLVSRLRHKDWRTRVAVAWAIGSAGGTAAVALKRLSFMVTKDPDWACRKIAAEVLADMGPSGYSAIPELATVVVADVDERVAEAAKLALSKLRTEMTQVIGRVAGVTAAVIAAQRIVQRFGSEERETRLAAMTLLEQSSTSPEVMALAPELIKMLLSRPPPVVGSMAIEALERLRQLGMLGSFETCSGSKAADSLAFVMERDGNPYVQTACAEALSCLLVAAENLAGKLRAYSQSEDPQLKNAAKQLQLRLAEAGAIVDTIPLTHKAYQMLVQRHPSGR